MPKRRVPRSNSVSSGRAARRATMSPNAVAGPVAKTTAVAVPLTTEVPRNTSAGASGPPDASAPVSAAFSAGSDSPVSARLLDVEVDGFDQARVGRHQVAGGEADDVARPRAASRGNSRHAPSRRTVAVGATCCWSRFTARSERKVCQKLIPALSETIAAMMAAFSTSPSDGRHRRRRRAGSARAGSPPCAGASVPSRRRSGARARSRRARAVAPRRSRTRGRARSFRAVRRAPPASDPRASPPPL